MSGIQGQADLADDSDLLLVRERVPISHERVEVAALHELHGDEVHAVGLAQVENPDYVFVSDLARENEFLLEPGQHFAAARQFL